jgi:dTDP-glucose 4,6-dehydratase
MDHVLAHTREIWEELRDARIFVTGGTGFLGCWLLETFAWAHDRLGLNNSMVVLTRSPEAFHGKAPHLAAHPAIRMIAGDVRTFEFPPGPFTHVIHAAAETNAALNREQPVAMLDTIVEGTRRALDFAVAAGAKRFLLTSSGAVYGAQPSALTHVPETYLGGPDQTDPRWTYGEGKRTAELLCSLYRPRIDCMIARCFAFAGPHLPLDAHFAIGNFIRDCLQDRAIEIKGDGTPYRSYLYTADLAIWLWTILVRGQSGRPYNVGAERDLTIAELARCVTAALGSPVKVTTAGTPQPGAQPERYVPATARAREELRLQEWISLEDAIRRTAAYSLRQSERDQSRP